MVGVIVVSGINNERREKTPLWDREIIGYRYHHLGRNRTMPDFENICKEKHIDSHRSFNNRMVGLSNQCVGFSEEDYQKLRELKAEDISLLEIKAFVDSQKSVCAHQKKSRSFLRIINREAMMRKSSVKFC